MQCTWQLSVHCLRAKLFTPRAGLPCRHAGMHSCSDMRTCGDIQAQYDRLTSASRCFLPCTFLRRKNSSLSNSSSSPCRHKICSGEDALPKPCMYRVALAAWLHASVQVAA